MVSLGLTHSTTDENSDIASVFCVELLQANLSHASNWLSSSYIGLFQGPGG